MANNLETSYPRIAIAAPTLNGNEKRYVLECLETTWISSIGRFITEFERAFARFCGVEHAIAVNNGTTALHLALVALRPQTRRRSHRSDPYLHRHRQRRDLLRRQAGARRL